MLWWGFLSPPVSQTAELLPFLQAGHTFSACLVCLTQFYPETSVKLSWTCPACHLTDLLSHLDFHPSLSLFRFLRVQDCQM